MKLFCRACRVIAEETHEQSETHQRNDDEWRSWMRIEQAIAMVDPAPCPPQWKPAS